jgi:hypothetical protein
MSRDEQIAEALKLLAPPADKLGLSMRHRI